MSLAVAVLFCAAPQVAVAEMGNAVVPTSTIYAGDMITQGHVTEVEVTNARLAGGYARSVDEVVGLVSKKTLVAGRTIPISALQEPYAIRRGTNVRLTFSFGTMQISASGSPLQDGMIGDVVRVRNLDSGVLVSGTVMANGSVEVMER
jgi:flagella basal body P-ring formation protein FlgA